MTTPIITGLMILLRIINLISISLTSKHRLLSLEMERVEPNKDGVLLGSGYRAYRGYSRVSLFGSTRSISL